MKKTNTSLRVKDLRKGDMYYYTINVGGYEQIKVFCYLGRSKNNDFLWFIVSDPLTFKEHSYECICNACRSGKGVCITGDIRDISHYDKPIGSYCDCLVGFNAGDAIRLCKKLIANF